MSRSIKLADAMPILAMAPEYNVIATKRGDLVMGFQLLKPELYRLSAPEYLSMHDAWLKAMNILPNNTILHLQDWYTRATVEIDYAAPEPATFLGQSSDRFFNERPYREHRCYLYLTRKYGSKKPVTSATSSLLQPTLVPAPLLKTPYILEFAGQCRQFIHLLTTGSAIQTRELTPDNLFGTKDTLGLVEQYFELGSPSAPPELQDIIFDNGIRIGNKELLLYTLSDAEQLPAQCAPYARSEKYSTDHTTLPIGFASPLGAFLDVDHVYNQYIFLDDPQLALRELETRQRRLHSLGVYSRENAVTQEAIKNYLDQAATPGQKPVTAHFNILAWTDQPAELTGIRQKIVAATTQMGATPHLETAGAPQLWWAGQPANAADLPANETFLLFAEQAPCFFIAESNSRTSLSPVGIRLADRHTGVPLHVDLSDEPLRRGLTANRNKVVLGGSGGGKSFAINHLLRNYHEQGAHSVVIDMGDSYKGLCELVGGQYFAYSKENPLCFNPFRTAAGEIMDTEKQESLKALLQTLWKKSGESFVRSEYIALSNLVEGYYAFLQTHPDIFPCFNSFYDWVREDFINELITEGIREKDFDCVNFLYVLKPYYQGGEFDWLLNATTEIDLLHQPFIVFELDKIKDHPILFPVITIVIMELFIGKMRKLRGTRKVIVIEEAWKAIASEGMSEFIRYLFKTVRKFFGEAIVVTQEVEDIISSPVVKNTIINQSDCKILLDLSKFTNRFDQLQQLLGLTEKDKALVLSLNRANEPGKLYKEVFVGLGTNHSAVYRLEPSLEEYLVYTTNESEKLRVQQYAAKYGGIRKGVAALAADIRSGTIKFLMAAIITAIFLLTPNSHASAQIIDVVEDAIKEALEQADLAIQRAQTETIDLQNAEKALENNMTDGLLDDITGWVQDEEDLYSDYYQELWTVKTALTTYSKVEQLIQRQVQLVNDYRQATTAIRQDPHFTPTELTHILNVYSGILNASIRNTIELATVIQSFVTQMDDAARLRQIDEATGRIDRNYADLREYTQENTLLSLERAKDEQDLNIIKNLYGIP